MLFYHDVCEIEEFMQKEWIPLYIKQIVNTPGIYKRLGIKTKKKKNYKAEMKTHLESFSNAISSQRIKYLEERHQKTNPKIITPPGAGGIITPN